MPGQGQDLFLLSNFGHGNVDVSSIDLLGRASNADSDELSKCLCLAGCGYNDIALLSLPPSQEFGNPASVTHCNNTRQTFGCQYPRSFIAQQLQLPFSMVASSQSQLDQCTTACDLDDEAAYWAIHNRLWTLHRGFWYVRALAPTDTLVFLYINMALALLSLFLNAWVTCLVALRPNLTQARIHLLSLFVANCIACIMAILANDVTTLMSVSANYSDPELYSENLETCYPYIELHFGRLYRQSVKDLYAGPGHVRRYMGPSRHVHVVTVFELVNFACMLVWMFSLIAFARVHLRIATDNAPTASGVMLTAVGIWFASIVLATAFYLPLTVFWYAYTELHVMHKDPNLFVLFKDLVADFTNDYNTGALARRLITFYRTTALVQLVFEGGCLCLLVLLYLWAYARVRLKQTGSYKPKAVIAANCFLQLRNGRTIALLFCCASVLPMLVYSALVFSTGTFYTKQKGVSREALYPPYIGLYCRLSNVFYLFLSPIFVAVFGASKQLSMKQQQLLQLSQLSPNSSINSDQQQQLQSTMMGSRSRIPSISESWQLLQAEPLLTKRQASEVSLTSLNRYNREATKKPPWEPTQVPLKKQRTPDLFEMDTLPLRRSPVTAVDTWLMDPKPYNYSIRYGQKEVFPVSVPVSMEPRRKPVPLAAMASASSSELLELDQAPRRARPQQQRQATIGSDNLPRKQARVKKAPLGPGPNQDQWKSTPDISTAANVLMQEARPWWLQGIDVEAMLPEKSRQPISVELSKAEVWPKPLDEMQRSKSVATLV